MKLVLFDLGDTLESGGVLLPGAVETLEAIAALRTDGQSAAVLGLVSDFRMPATPADVAGIQQEYYSLLEDLGIRQFFEPVAERVTLSTEVGVFKPDQAVFRAAASKAGSKMGLSNGGSSSTRSQLAGAHWRSRASASPLRWRLLRAKLLAPKSTITGMLSTDVSSKPCLSR